ncbi:hypothetical protein [Streptomyces sp. NBC_01789]|uniref:hypothetical protein n=1 Tax=Streptomyces sp. NBC_01789 TaxID=2975941 RepID=UPI00225036C8|nr:hypothetical protein [Streptomyces sp. NBC_01789]MCX4450723.1 hypothetical protein [Streptomyces sp. NBC_01789]
MATVGRAGLPIPNGGDAPVGPGALAALAEAIDPHLMQHVTDKAQRDSLFGDAPLHTAVTAEDGSLWVKTSASTSTWATIYEPLPSWRPITLKSGMVEGDVQLGVRRRQGVRVSLKGRIAKADGTNINEAFAANLGAVPSDCIPSGLRGFPALCSLGGATIQAVGRLEVIGSNTSSAYGVAGDLIWWFQDPAGTAWVDITGDYWMD